MIEAAVSETIAERLLLQPGSDWGDRLDTTYTVLDGSTATVLFPDNDDSLVVKVLHDVGQVGEYDAYREATLLSLLAESDTPPPLQLPKVEYSNGQEDPFYIVMQRLPGKALSYSEISTLTIAEKVDLGRKIGEFAAWMSRALSIESYHDNIPDDYLCGDSSARAGPVLPVTKIGNLRYYDTLSLRLRGLGCDDVRALPGAKWSGS